MNSVDALILSRPYIEKGWCQGALARDERGRSCMANSERAVEWCAVGALMGAEVAFGATGAAILLLQSALGRPTRDYAYTGEIVSWNNAAGSTQEQVLVLWDKAIALGLEREGES